MGVAAMPLPRVLAPDDDGIVVDAIRDHIAHNLTAKDQQLLHKLERDERIDVDTLSGDGYSAEDLLWLVFHGVAEIEVDDANRTYLVKTIVGRQVLDAMRQR